VAARFGILIKDARALEIAHRVDTAAFDKTGTLTEGRPRLLALHPAPGVDQAAALRAAASLQSGSEHLLARAVLTAARERQCPIDPAHDVRAVPGRGVEGQVAGHAMLIGSLRWMQELGVDMEPFAALAQEQQAQGATVSVLAVLSPRPLGGEGEGEGVRNTGLVDRGSAVALLAFGDAIKPGAAAALAALRARGVRTVMISGDNRAAAEAVARPLGLDPEQGEVLAEVLPEGKVAVIEQLRGADAPFQRPGLLARIPLGNPSVLWSHKFVPPGDQPTLPRQTRRTIAMIGDGVNDAPALAAADVGIAMGSGTDVAMHAAGITLMRGDVALVPAALDISRRTVAKIRQNLFWAFIYNVAGIPLAALGYLNPVLAGAAMALSSVSVMGNALLLRRWRPPH
jgi:Cu+-exporting ATPase